LTLMRIAFRTDASVQIGTGHVMRCLTLADSLYKHGVECQFICRQHTGHLLDLIDKRGHRAVALPALSADTAPLQTGLGPAHAYWLGTNWARDAADTRLALGDAPVDWLVVDHYSLDARWEQTLRSTCKRLMVIDDLADRPHDCDLLLDQNLGRTVEDYSGLIPSKASTLIGPQYALLRSEFVRLRAESLARRATPELRRLLITMGGVDKDNATGRVLDALNTCALPHDLSITVVMGQYAPWLQKVQKQVTQLYYPTEVLVGVSDMARLMANSDLAIGAAGSTSWERCCLGLPSIVLVLADNQKAGAAALQKSGAAIVIQSVPEIQNLFRVHLAFDRRCKLLQEMSRAAEQVTDGQGCTFVTQQVMANNA
jgi:UDP-2,4-diacetamido-2,4,6-trideoxy-beta-L-altropyranose hydrolase